MLSKAFLASPSTGRAYASANNEYPLNRVREPNPQQLGESFNSPRRSAFEASWPTRTSRPPKLMAENAGISQRPSNSPRRIHCYPLASIDQPSPSPQPALIARRSMPGGRLSIVIVVLAASVYWPWCAPRPAA